MSVPPEPSPATDTVSPVPERSGSPGISRLWRRELLHYPATRSRYRLLALVVLSSIVMYY